MDTSEIVERFLSALKADPPDTGVLNDILTPGAKLESTSGGTDGRDAVVQRFIEPAGRAFRESRWSAPEPAGDGLKVSGVAPGLGSGGTILVFYFDGENVARILHQFFTARVPGSGKPIHLTQELKDKVERSLEEKHPMVVAYVDERGAPVLSFRGSIQAFSGTQLAMWVRPKSRMAEAIQKNPNVALIYRNEDTHEGFQFQGRAHIATDQADIRHVYERSPAIERERDMAQLGVAVIIDLDLVEGGFVRIKRESERVQMERNEA